jgi:hypothetical protein
MTFETGTHDLTGTVLRHSGDVNLVAALMSLGIPLENDDPVSVVDSPNASRPYGSFRFHDLSDDGETDAETLMQAWSGDIVLEDTHGFAQICRFIRARPRGSQRSDALLDFAIEYLQERGHTMPGLRTLNDIPDFVRALPQGEAAYVLAYVWNREICYQLFRQASRRVHLTEGTGKDTRHAILDTRLPKWKSRELLSRLQG